MSIIAKIVSHKIKINYGGMLKNCWEMFGDNHKVILLTAELLMFSGRWGIIISSYVAYQTPVESSRPMAIQTAMDKLSGSLNKENRHE